MHFHQLTFVSHYISEWISSSDCTEKKGTRRNLFRFHIKPSKFSKKFSALVKSFEEFHGFRTEYHEALEKTSHASKKRFWEFGWFYMKPKKDFEFV